ncbi:MAG: PEP-CTERM sorting domain-containing protein [Spirochaetota bacterium]
MKQLYILLLIILLFGCESADTGKPGTDNVTGTDQDTEYPGSVLYTDPSIAGWAEAYTAYQPGEECDEMWQTPERSLGPADGTTDGIVCLGRGGTITFVFTDMPIADRDGADFAVFGNSFSDSFLELAFVEVSSDGETFVGFPAYSYTKEPVGPYGTVSFTDVYDINRDYTGFAGVHPVAYGTLFDLADLPVHADLDTASVTHVRLVDIPGDGSVVDSSGNPIYDPYPCTGSAGFDCDALGVINYARVR